MADAPTFALRRVTLRYAMVIQASHADIDTQASVHVSLALPPSFDDESIRASDF